MYYHEGFYFEVFNRFCVYCGKWVCNNKPLLNLDANILFQMMIDSKHQFDYWWSALKQTQRPIAWSVVLYCLLNSQMNSDKLFKKNLNVKKHVRAKNIICMYFFWSSNGNLMTLTHLQQFFP